MKEAELDIITPDGSMNTFITYPEEGGPYPIILFLMDAPGKREELHDMARRIGTVGFYVMLPNLYYRRTPEFVIDGTPESREIMFEHMNSLSNAMVVEDCRILLDYAANQSAASDGPVGCTGYCMSGPFAFAVAAQIADLPAVQHPTRQTHHLKLRKRYAILESLRSLGFRVRIREGGAHLDEAADDLALREQRVEAEALVRVKVRVRVRVRARARARARVGWG